MTVPRAVPSDTRIGWSIGRLVICGLYVISAIIPCKGVHGFAKGV